MGKVNSLWQDQVQAVLDDFSVGSAEEAETRWHLRRLGLDEDRIDDEVAAVKEVV